MKFKNYIEVQSGIKDSANSSGTPDQVLTSTATGVAWVDPSTISAEAATLVVIECKNTSGATITKGTPVYQTGTVGATDVIEIAPADALISAGSQPAIGLLQTTLNDNGFGKVVITGELLNFTTDPIDGVTPTTGDKVFLKSGGGLTLTKPTGAGNAIQNLGLIGKVSGGSAGSITVASIMRANDVPNLPTGKIWVGDSNTIVSDTVYLDEPNGRMGIGTTSPAEKLDVSGRVLADAFRTDVNTSDYSVISRSSAGNAPLYVQSADSNTNQPIAKFFYGNAAPNQGTIVLNVAKDSTYFSNTNVGIGTTSPSYRFTAYGSNTNSEIVASFGSANDQNEYTAIGLSGFIASNGATKAGLALKRTGTYGTGELHFLNNNTLDNSDMTLSDSKMMIDASGNVGIGTTSPQQKLQVASPTDTSVVLGASYSSINNNNFFEVGISANDGYLNLRNSGVVTTVHIDSDNSSYFNGGNVGIGTTSPDQKLHVSGNARVTGAYYDSNNSPGTSGQVLSSTATGTDWVSAGGTSGFAPMVKFNRSGINSSTYTMIATVNGNNLSSVLKMTMTGTSGNVVFACTFDITVNHSQDIHVKSSNGDYTEVTLRITSDGNEDFSIEAKHNGGTTTQAEVCIYPLADEIITPTTTDPGYTGAEYEHTATEGWRYGGEDNDVESSNVVVDGKVGIGTTSPGAKLEVNGQIVINSTELDGNDAFSIYNNTNELLNVQNSSTGDEASLFLGAGNVRKIKLDTAGSSYFNGGSVGIGTTSPLKKLSINGGDVAVNNGNSFIVGAAITGNTQIGELGADSGQLQLLTESTRDIKFGSTTYGNIMFLEGTNGNVGIGTTSPSAKLQVNSGGSGNVTSFQSEATAINEYAGITLHTQTNSGSDWYGSEIRSINTVGTPSFLNPRLGFFTQDLNTYLPVDRTEKLSILGNGNVGIGTTSPGAKLDVVGSGLATLFRVSNTTADATTKYGAFTGRHYTNSEENITGMLLTSSSSATGGTVSIGGGISAANAVNNIILYTAANNTTLIGTERMRINSSGNVGIGTTSPGQKLDVDGSVNIDGTLFVNTNNNHIRLIDTDNTGNFSVGVNTNFQIRDITANTTPLTIRAGTPNDTILTTASGRVGIGLSSPSTTLHVNGFTRINGGLQMNTANVTIYQILDSDLRFGTNNTERMRITNTGQVGIGITAITASVNADDLQIGNGTGGNRGLTVTAQSNSGAAIYFGDADNTNMGSVRYDNSNDSMKFFTNTSERMRIDSSGNVGIGTTTPNAKLNVNGGIKIEGTNSLSFGGGASVPAWGINSSGNDLIINDQATTVGDVLFTNAGNVGIGTTSTSDKLHVDGTIRSQAPLTTDWGFIGLNSAGSASSGLWFSSGSGELLLRRSDNSLQTKIVSAGSSYINGGNLGLGTTSPAQKLTVDSGRMLVSNTTTPIYIKAGSTYKSWVHHIGGSDGYIFAPSTADNGETWDWANQTKLGADGVVTAKNFQLSSDRRFKNNIKDIKDIRVEAAFKSFEMESSPGEKRYGVVAQELEKTNPELVGTDHEGFKSVKYIDLLIAKIAELEARLEKLEK